jgi:hypothetical protein
MKKWLQNHSNVMLLAFIILLGLTGALSADINKVVYVVSLIIFLLCYFKELTSGIRQQPYIRNYFRILIFFVLFGILLIVIWSFLPNKYNIKPTYGGVEELLFNYTLLPLFCYAMGMHVSQRKFEQVMVTFGCCTVLSGFFLLFAYFDFHLFLNSPIVFFQNVLQCRFTECESPVSWIEVFCKDYSFFPTLGALVVVPFVTKYKGWKQLLVIAVVLLNTFFLFLTVNRGTIIGFFIAISLVFFRAVYTFQWKKKLIYTAGFFAVCGIAIYIIPQSIKVRFVEMYNESCLFFEAGHTTGSVSSRLNIWETLLTHVDSFWLFGDGPIYATNKLRIYLTEAGFESYVQLGFIYHNQYLTYFHHYGIIGLLFLPAMLLYPIYVMVRRRQFSVTLASILILFLFALLEDRYLGKAKVVSLLFFVYFSFFQVEKWKKVEVNGKRNRGV